MFRSAVHDRPTLANLLLRRHVRHFPVIPVRTFTMSSKPTSSEDILGQKVRAQIYQVLMFLTK